MQVQNCYILEQWYNKLEQYTMPTKFISLSSQQIDLIILSFNAIYDKYFKQLYLIKNKTQQSFVNSKFNWMNHESINKIIIENNLKQVKQQLIQKIKHQISQNHKYFVKLSLRSPKDSLALRKYKEKLSNKYSQQQYSNLNSQLQRLALIVTNAQDTLQILCSSQRICDDLKRLQKNKNYTVNIIIREWKTIPSCLQFRVFMKNKIITAISSYYKSQRHQWLIKYKNIIKQSIIQFFNKNIKNNVPYINGIFDIGFQLPQKDIYLYNQIQQKITNSNYKVIIIQINPFSKQTGAALFSWQIDKEILNNGPLQIRLSGQDDFNN